MTEKTQEERKAEVIAMLKQKLGLMERPVPPTEADMVEAEAALRADIDLFCAERGVTPSTSASTAALIAHVAHLTKVVEHLAEMVVYLEGRQR